MEPVTDGRWLAIGEACRALGISRTTLLAAEEAGLVTSARTPGGHRRYAAAELRRYLGPAGPFVPEPAEEPAPSGAPAIDPGLAGAVRAAVRPVVRVLGGECGGLYLEHRSVLRFAGAFGIPRWLGERLAEAPAPECVAGALPATRARPFDPADSAFPDARSTGHGAVVGLQAAAGPPLGVLFVVLPAAPLPAELAVVDGFAETLALLLTERARTAELEDRLGRIATLSSTSQTPW